MPDLVTVVVTLCLVHGPSCIDRVVTDRAPRFECEGPVAQVYLSQWFSQSPFAEQGYQLQGWQCRSNRIPT